MESRGWFDIMRDAFYDALCAVFEVDPDLQSSLDRFIPAYVEGISTPEEDGNVNVCYYAISVEQGTTEDYVTIENQKDKVVVTKTIPVNVLVTFYGPNADNDSEKFWNKVVLRGTPDRPISLPEEEGTLWRRRCDVRVHLSYLDTDTIPARTVERVPDINITLAGITAGKENENAFDT